MNTFRKVTLDEYEKKRKELDSNFTDTLGIYDAESIQSEYNQYCIHYDSYIDESDDSWFVRASGVGGMYAFLYDAENNVIKNAIADFAKNVIDAPGVDDATVVKLALGYIEKTTNIDDPRYYQLNVLRNYLLKTDNPPKVPPAQNKLTPLFNDIPLGSYLRVVALGVLCNKDYNHEQLTEYIINNVPRHETYKFGCSYGRGD